MKCLSVKQPWADLIVSGYKNIENRVWYSLYTGPLLIQATKTIDKEGYKKISESAMAPLQDVSNYNYGKIVGIVNVVGADKPFQGDMSIWRNENCYGWKLKNPLKFENPIEQKGQLGIYKIKNEETKSLIIIEVRKALEIKLNDESNRIYTIDSR